MTWFWTCAFEDHLMLRLPAKFAPMVKIISVRRLFLWAAVDFGASCILFLPRGVGLILPS
jgi:hypothetical protein